MKPYMVYESENPFGVHFVQKEVRGLFFEVKGSFLGVEGLGLKGSPLRLPFLRFRVPFKVSCKGSGTSCYKGFPFKGSFWGFGGSFKGFIWWFWGSVKESFFGETIRGCYKG